MKRYYDELTSMLKVFVKKKSINNECLASYSNKISGLVSIIILNWNKKDDLLALLKSIKKQTYKNYEIIVVDNASTDGSIEMVEKKFPKVIIIANLKNVGVVGWNHGFKITRGEYICFLDNDVILPGDWIQKLVSVFKHKEDCIGLLAPKVIDPDGLRWPSKLKVEKSFFCGDFQGSGFMSRKKALEKTQLYPKNYFLFENEHALAAQLLNAGFKILYVPEVSHFHKGRLKPSPKRIYYTTRNGLFTIWRYYPTKLLILYTLRHVILCLISSILKREPIAFIKALFSAVKLLPHYLDIRAPVQAPELFIRR